MTPPLSSFFHIAAIFICGTLCHLAKGQHEFDANFTLQSIFGRLQPGVKSAIQCTSSNEAPNKIKISRLDTGQGTRLPRQSLQYLQGKPMSTRILFMFPEDGLARFGAFQCKLTKHGVATETVALKLPPLSEAELDAKFPYQVANIGDDVTLNVTVLKKLNLPIRWLHNSKQQVSSWDNQTSIQITDVKKSDAGIYEAFYLGRRNESLHALMRLIVRGCPSGFYGEECSEECPPCYNGGICHDIWGVCVCPAGFTGANCEQACGGNRFGAACDKLCTTPRNDTDMDDGCALFMFCKPDPYGCSCASGFKGPQCMGYCEEGYYGPDCNQLCHCAYGSSACNRITGACRGGCADGWRGGSCEIEDPNATAGPLIETTTMTHCEVGRYGPSCEKFCHCADDEMCNVVTGHCPSGCKDSWDGSSCSVCSVGIFGDNCEFSCHCQGGHSMCDKEGYCYTGCEAGWAGFTCQQECTPGRFGQNCASTCHCLLDGDTCNKISGHCLGDCEPGFMGDDCQKLCPPMSYGINCQYNCSCFNGGHCNRINGKCACEGRWRGTVCNESEPQIIAATDEEVNSGQITFISCTADAVPEPEMNIESKDFPELTFDVRILEKNQYQAVMKVKPQIAGEFAFSCSVKNHHGFDVRIVTLSVIEPPELINAPVLVKTTKYSITVEWEHWKFGIDSGGKLGDVIEYLVVYREAGKPEWLNHETWKLDTFTTIENLNAYKEYEIAVKCRRQNKGGEGNPGPFVTVRTECGDSLSTAIPQNFLPDEMAPNFVRLTWKDPPELLLQCKLVGYNLMYFPFEDSESSGVNSVSINNVTNEFELYDIPPSSLYVYRLYPVTEIGRSKYYAELIFRTTELVPGPVEDLEYKVLEASDMLLIKWKAPAVMKGFIKGYNVTYELVDRGHCGRVIQDKDLQGMFSIITENTEITLQNLLPYSTYFVTVAAKTASGEGDASFLAAMTTESSPDNGPPNLRLISTTSTTLEFQWDPIPCESANGIIIEYEYTVVTTDIAELSEIPLYAKAKRSADVDMSSTLKKVKGLKALIQDLVPYAEYGFAVRGLTKVDAGPFSEFIFAKTKQGAPTAPRHFVIDSVASNYLTVSWIKPEPANGVIQEYRIRCQPVQQPYHFDFVYNLTKNESVQEKYFRNVTNLEGGMNYVLKIQAFTAAGWGNWSEEALGRTLDGIPEMPAEVTLVNSEEYILEISWKPPLIMNGKITGYKVKYIPVSSLDSSFDVSAVFPIELLVNSDATSIILRELHPSTQYSVQVEAHTSAGYGPPSSPLLCWTLIQSGHILPSVRTLNFEATNETVPVIFSTEGKSKVHKYQVIVEDARNNEPINESLLSDYETAVVEQGLPYYIAAELDPADVADGGQESFVVGDKKIWGGFKNVHLNPGHEYRIRIRTLIKNEDNDLKSVLSERKEQVAVTSVSDVSHDKRLQIFGLDHVPFTLIVISIFVLIFIISFFTAFVICRRRERRKKKSGYFNRDSGLSESLTWSVMYKASENECCDGPLVSEGWKYSGTIDKSSMKKSKTYAKNCQGIPVENLAEYVHNASNSSRLAEEFKQLVSGQTAQWTLARKSENLKKNRYGNILPYDRFRVVLQPEQPGDSDYINASFIDGYRRPQEYIVTQGPLDCTVVDFWRMVWQENAPVIIMLTYQVENGKQRCSKYWPDDSMVSGNIHILNIFTEECTDFVIRTLLLRKTDEGRTHRVLQYQFTGWPDRTVPSNAYSLLKMIKRVRDDNPVLGGPMVVHCSAGAGRSGTYITLDALIQQAHEEKRVDIFRFVNNARLQRINLVQTMEQYLFIHEALLEALLLEDTSVPLELVALHLQEMRQSSTLNPKSLIRRHFQMLKHSQKKFDVANCSIALSESNIFKNRDPMAVPADSSRVCLQSESECISAAEDYINAVFVDGYRQKNRYLVTQMPLHHTVEDFWKLVYQSKSSLILMLNNCDEDEDANIGQYWPNNGHCKYGSFEVQVITFEDQNDFSVRVMRLMKHDEPYAEIQKVIQLHYKAWYAGQQVPESPESMLNLLELVDQWYQHSNGGPIIVHCMDGTVRSGLFCAVSYVCDQGKAENILDVYQTVKTIRTNRPEFISSLEQFSFCFKVANALVHMENECTEGSLGNMTTFSCKV